MRKGPMPTIITVTGVRGGHQSSVTWKQGDLFGDALLVDEVLDLVRIGREVSQGGLATGPATLDITHGPELVVATLSSVFDDVLAIAGVEPETVGAGSEQ